MYACQIQDYFWNQEITLISEQGLWQVYRNKTSSLVAYLNPVRFYYSVFAINLVLII